MPNSHYLMVPLIWKSKFGFLNIVKQSLDKFLVYIFSQFYCLSVVLIAVAFRFLFKFILKFVVVVVVVVLLLV